jgi:hypothetical protein
MIYKFEDCADSPIIMEVKKDSQTYEEFEVVAIKTTCIINQSSFTIELSKKDIYHLIGALHLLHKEMK